MIDQVKSLQALKGTFHVGSQSVIEGVGASAHERQLITAYFWQVGADNLFERQPHKAQGERRNGKICYHRSFLAGTVLAGVGDPVRRASVFQGE